MTIVASKPTITQVARVRIRRMEVSGLNLRSKIENDMCYSKSRGENDADVFRQQTEKLNLPVASSFSALPMLPVE